MRGCKNAETYNPTEECEGWDSNPRTPTRLGPQPSAFDLAWLPSLLCHNIEVVYLIKDCAFGVASLITADIKG